MSISLSKDNMDIVRYRLIFTKNGIFLVPEDNISSNKSIQKWQYLADDMKTRTDMLFGFDDTFMQLKPMTIPKEWKDIINIGPYFTIVQIGRTANKNSVLDVEYRDTGHLDKLQRNVIHLYDEIYSLTIPQHYKYIFLLGSEHNDDSTNGSIIVVKDCDHLQNIINGIRKQIFSVDDNSQDFSDSHLIHTTICKIADKEGYRGEIRHILSKWPMGDQYPLSLTNLNDAKLINYI